ncbi:uncharacterized protein BT62DRAFT_288784 [Guyanagaster necrorhizus]|uniref:Protein kinase domain-containing protein n=1 Tax=Guyanagaster necrorhizus TaxID=856835 RepID=A0A9P7W4W8_9AGAR|nr:uncharacterized protein BT62DRAFT_288784 [Guyanagaster necrorhizus MCA 3950]KAG7452202.1 hypothetical protein BT62DRAFT_288784 [Guyanagaster necrorhizus MCA 3950]
MAPLSLAHTIEVIFDRTHVSRMWSWKSVNGISGHVDLNASPQVSIHCVEGLRLRRVFRAFMGLYGCKPTTPVIIKVAFTEDKRSLLQREENVYNQYLKDLQGSFIPKCYGLFEGSFGGQKITCLVLEYCSPENIRPVDYSRQVMTAINKIHQAGIVHQDIVHKSKHILTTSDGVRIIDFATAQSHKCPTMPLAFVREVRHCEELVSLEYECGFSDDTNVDGIHQRAPGPSPLPDGGLHSRFGLKPSYQKLYPELSRSHRHAHF